MVKKRLDDRIRHLLQHNLAQSQRSFLVIVGDQSHHSVSNLYAILSKQAQRRLSILWCYKQALQFSSHKQKRLKKLQKDKKRGLLDPTDDALELFLAQADIQYCYYKDSHRILGTTCDFLVLQDFEALTPNLLARTMETVAGGGLIVLLLQSVSSLKQLYAMTMDVHARYRTASAHEIVPRFNERLILSWATCSSCLVCDDELNVLPISRKVLRAIPSKIVSIEPAINEELVELQKSLEDTPHIGALVALTKTLDQAKAVLVFLDACSERQHTPNTVVALTAARGRGKSAALGLCLAGAVALGYSQIVVTAPEPENLGSVFEFCQRGLQALQYQNHVDYNITYNAAKGREETKCIVSISIHRSHRQVIQYVAPTHADHFASAEIVAIDEAAAIPLPMIRKLMQPNRLVFLSSTVNGYEGTGRALSLKLLEELRSTKSGRAAELQSATAAARTITGPKSNKKETKLHEQRWNAAAAALEQSRERLSGSLREVELTTPIRYAEGDPVEAWLNKLLCLDSGSTANLKLSGGAPAPADCEMYSVDRDALFSFHKLSEAFLQKIMGLYTSAHYKNTPNDLQMLSDAPAHLLFVLVSSRAEQDENSLPDVLAVVQVALEGRISRKAVEAQLARGHRSAGDLIPWTISQQFGDSKFAQLSGARIVRIAVHPSAQGMGYGSRAMELLYRFYNGDLVSLAMVGEGEEDEDENLPEPDTSVDGSDNEFSNQSGLRGERLKPRKELPPLLLPLTEVEAPQLDWIGTSFGLTLQLHKFWNRMGMKLLYLRQTKNDLTGEHSAIMLRTLPKRSAVDHQWLASFLTDVRRRVIALMSGPFRDLDLRLAASLLGNCENPDILSGASQMTAGELTCFMTSHDLKRLEQYGRNLCDHHLVADLMPAVCRLYFTGRFGKDFSLSSVQAALLCALGLQSRDVDAASVELGLPASQVLAMFNKAERKISIALNAVVEENEKKALLGGQERKRAEEVASRMKDVAERTLAEDAADAAEEATETMKKMQQASLPVEISKNPELMQYFVQGSDQQWKDALNGKEMSGPAMIQIKSGKVRRKVNDDEIEGEHKKFEQPMKPKKKKKPRRS